MDSLRMQDDFEIGVAKKNSDHEKSDSSSEDEVAVLHEQNRIKKILNDVFNILKIPMIIDIRNSDILYSQVNRACEFLQSMRDNLLNDKKEKEELPAGNELLSLTFSEKNELINGLKNLYHVSNKQEQVRLLTIAPTDWGRQRLQKFFDSSERQARRSLQIRASKGVLASPEDLRGNKSLDTAVADAVIKFYEEDWISRVSTDKSDVLLIKTQPVAKRFMLLTMGEAFEEFKIKFPQYVIGKSKFYDLRPRYVQPTCFHDTCCCMYHENFDLLLKVKIKFIFSRNH
ncbi:unnamed protein product [Rotaria sp. Silwood1]|nr:unnamed protein product [Rotaria sp. Silwood1]CAF3926011.1 unnamed protein product [Rotaria sp. Silwood1]